MAGLFSTHLLSLDALLTVVDSIEQHCHSRILNTPKHEPEPKQEASSYGPLFMKIHHLKQCPLSKSNIFYQNFMKLCHID